MNQKPDEDAERQIVDADDSPSTAANFDEEIVRTRRNEKLMALLDERGKQTKTLPLEVVKQQLGIL